MPMVTRNVINIFEHVSGVSSKMADHIIRTYPAVAAAGRIWAPFRCRMLMRNAEPNWRPASFGWRHQAARCISDIWKPGQKRFCYGPIWYISWYLLYMIVYVCVWLYTYLTQSIVPNKFFFGGGKWSNGCLLDLRWSVWVSQAPSRMALEGEGEGVRVNHSSSHMQNRIIWNNNE